VRQDDAIALRNLLSKPISNQERRRILFVLGTNTALSADESTPLRAGLKNEGAFAVFDTTGGRGEDFAKNQDQGFWAEQLLRTFEGPIRFVYFGLSDPISPWDPKYEATRRKHRYILLTEGKRPDLLVFEAATVRSNPQILQWPEAPLTEKDVTLLQETALAGAEIKSSLQHYAGRQKYRTSSGAGDISVTVKQEEFTDLARWERDFMLPIVLMQVLVDAIFIMSYQTFRLSKGRSSFERKTAKQTRFVAISGNARAFARIVLDEPGFSFRVHQNGAVERPASWPAAHLANVEIPDFAGLKQHYRRSMKPH
jgi:hypothetical protein